MVPGVTASIPGWPSSAGGADLVGRRISTIGASGRRQPAAHTRSMPSRVEPGEPGPSVLGASMRTARPARPFRSGGIGDVARVGEVCSNEGVYRVRRDIRGWVLHVRHSGGRISLGDDR